MESSPKSVTSTASATNTAGEIVQVIGPVIDADFSGGTIPEILDALEIDRGAEGALVLEVQQHLGEGPRPRDRDGLDRRPHARHARS